jgi:iron complex transport system substrate-binding protein
MGITVTDGAGRTITLTEPARRVASMVPAATDWLLAMGVADRIVARTEYDGSPLLRDVPAIGGGLSPSVEWLAARQPDLVIAWADGPARSTVARLESMGIPVYVAPAETIDQALTIAVDLGRLLGVEAAADSVVATVHAGLDGVRNRVRDRPPPSTLFLIGLDPLTGAGPGTFVDELIRVAGGRNLLGDLRHTWPPISLEEVVRRDPDVIILGSAADPSLDLLRARPGWRSLSAVQAGRVHSVDPIMVNRWGPRLHEAADLLADHIHGPALP